MKHSQFSYEQIVRILQVAARLQIAKVSKRYEVRGLSIYSWRKKFDELDIEDAKYLKQFELKKRSPQEDLGRGRFEFGQSF